MPNTVSVPEEFRLLFQKAQEYVGRYFNLKTEDPSKGTIEIFGERYILVRAASMSVDFFETVRNLYRDYGDEVAVDVARNLLYDIAHAIGKMDARNFHRKMDLKDPIEKLSAGPVHFSHSGWAFVDIFPESQPSPDEDYYLIYDHPFSFESDAWSRSGRTPTFPVCVMNAGYSSGWCEESFGVALVASEIMCRAKGDEACRFIMAHPSRIERRIQAYWEREPQVARPVTEYRIPGFLERKQMEEALRQSEERFGQVVENAEDWVWEVDQAGLYTYSSPVVERILGYTAQELVGKKHFYDLFPPEDREEFKKKAFATLAQREAFRGFMNRKLHRNGKTVWFLTSGVPMVDGSGNLRGSRGVDTDITTRKEAEDRQERLMAEVENTNQELKDFAFIVSHDLKAPLRGIKTIADWISTDYADKLDEDGREQLGLLAGRVDRMHKLLEGVLQYSRLGRVHEQSVAVNLGGLIPQVINMIAPPDSVEITIRTELPTIECEPTRISEIFQNLLSNAVKFLDKAHGQIEISCSDEGAFWKFGVADNGPGIEEKHFQRIFQIFQTLSPRDTFESTGVGLAIVKKTVEMYGGRVWLESTVGEGSTFYFTLPKQASAGPVSDLCLATAAKSSGCQA